MPEHVDASMDSLPRGMVGHMDTYMDPLMSRLFSQQNVVAKRRLCPELNDSLVYRAVDALKVDCSVSSGLP